MIPFICFVSISPPNKPGRHTRDYGKRGDVMGYHSAGANDAALANAHTGQEDGACSDIGQCFHTDRVNLEISLNNWLINRRTGVRRAQDLSTRAPTHMIFSYEMAGIEVGLRPDPNVISNLRNAIKASLNIRLSPNENPIPDLKRFQVPKADTTADPNTVAKCSCDRSPDASTHQAIQLAITIRKPGIVFQKRPSGVTCGKMSRQIHLERRIWIYLTRAVNCRDNSDIVLQINRNC